MCTYLYLLYNFCQLVMSYVLFVITYYQMCLGFISYVCCLY